MATTRAPLGVEGAAPRSSRFGRLLRRVTTSDAELEAEKLQESVEDEGATPVVSCRDRHRVKAIGTLRTVTQIPKCETLALEADLWDGSAQLRLVWLGRRSIAGIEPGRRLCVEGLVQVVDDQRTMYNPKYTLRPAGAP